MEETLQHQKTAKCSELLPTLARSSMQYQAVEKNGEALRLAKGNGRYSCTNPFLRRAGKIDFQRPGLSKQGTVERQVSRFA